MSSSSPPLQVGRTAMRRCQFLRLYRNTGPNRGVCKSSMLTLCFSRRTRLYRRNRNKFFGDIRTRSFRLVRDRVIGSGINPYCHCACSLAPNISPTLGPVLDFQVFLPSGRRGSSQSESLRGEREPFEWNQVSAREIHFLTAIMVALVRGDYE
jgi:hypothetical protein